jgi:hypothetical protein
MSTVVNTGRPAAPLTLKDSNPALFVMLDDTRPVAVTLPGSVKLDLALFDVTAVGYAEPLGPGTLTVTLYGRPSLADPSTDPALWLPIASSPAEPIGGEGDLPQAVFMLKAEDLLANSETGKIQGTFKSNVASNPQPAADLTQHPRDVAANKDPLYVFAVGASFTPTGDNPECSVTLVSLTLSA